MYIGGLRCYTNAPNVQKFMKNLRESKDFTQRREPIQLELFSEITAFLEKE